MVYQRDGREVNDADGIVTACWKAYFVGVRWNQSFRSAMTYLEVKSSDSIKIAW